MSAKVFLDTNVLVYAALGTAKDDRKRERALVLIESEEFGTSAQVLQEFFVTVTRKAVRPLPVERALEWIQQLIIFPCYPIDHRIVRIASSKQNGTGSRIGMPLFYRPLKLWDVRLFTRRISTTDRSIQAYV